MAGCVVSREDKSPSLNQIEQPQPLRRKLSQCLSKTVKTVVYKDESHGSTMLQGLQRLRSSGSFCDLKLSINSKIIPVHKVVLAAVSPYFAAMFDSKMKESQDDTVTLTNFKENVIQRLVDFMYTGSLDITGEVVQDLLIASDFFNITTVQEACSQFIFHNTDLENCIDILQFAENQAAQSLYKYTVHFIAENYAPVSELEDFGLISLTAMYDILQHDGLWFAVNGKMIHPCEQEEKLGDSVVRYIQPDFEAKEQHLPKLLNLIKLPMIKEGGLWRLRNIIMTIGKWDEGHPCIKVIDDAMRLSVSGEGLSFEDYWTTPRKVTEMVNFVGQWHVNMGKVWPEIEQFDDPPVKDNVWLSGMKIWVRKWDPHSSRGGGTTSIIGAIKLLYSDETSIMHGYEEAQETHEFHLNKDERIVKSEVMSDWMLDQISFYSNQGRKFGPYGGDRGKKHLIESCKPWMGYLWGMKGSIVVTEHNQTSSESLLCQHGITRLRFKWACNKFLRDDDFKRNPALAKLQEPDYNYLDWIEPSTDT